MKNKDGNENEGGEKEEEKTTVDYSTNGKLENK